jgi:hypothetical protein
MATARRRAERMRREPFCPDGVVAFERFLELSR